MKEKRSRTSGFIALVMTSVAMVLAAHPSFAQDTDDSGASAAAADEMPIEEILVTGSRIRRSPADTMAPIGTIGAETFAERGYTSAASALNDFTSNIPQLNQAPGDGNSSGPGQQFPNLFGLGTGRTLTLVNGHRFVTSSVGLGDAQVDANIIPTGLIDRIEIVQAGGAAVYGSDAIAGVVNYVLKDDFEGLELDAQFGDASRDDYEQRNYHVTYGFNFDDGRGNLAFNVEWSSSPILRFRDRPLSNLARITTTNAADTGPNDGIPSVREVLDARFWTFTENGVLFGIPPAPFPQFLTRLNGTALQFASDGSVVPYDEGDVLSPPFAEGGEGFRYSDLAGLRTGVDRATVTAIGHYDVNDHLKVSGQLLFANTEGKEVPQGYARTVLSPDPFGPIQVFNFNPFLTPEAVATLSQASPAFAAGAPLFLSRHFYFDLFPSNTQDTSVDNYYAMLSVEGDFDGAGRNFYWTVSGSYGRVEGEQRAWDVDNARFANAIFALPDGAGGAVCLINVDGDPTNDDPSCAPLNPFGFGNISDAARTYVSRMVGMDYTNDQYDFLATIGTSLFTLPGGDADAVFAYEHRREEASFVPLPANQLGLTGTGTPEIPQSGHYDTNEFSVEVLIPLVGGDMSVPGVQELELNGTYRYVDNSIAGTESVWSAGLRWQVVDDLTLRVTRSRNFRAPTLTQLLAPVSVGAGSTGFDPCDADRITAGPDPATRLANCQAEWAAHPEYGPLEDFQDPAENFIVAEITTGGNPDLKNEISDTWTYGFVLQPRFVPGLTLSADRIEIDLEDGLSAFEPADFTATCYDSSPQPADICGTFERTPVTVGTSPPGTIVKALSTTFNAGVIEYRGEYYVLDYQLPMENSKSRIGLTVDVTHNSKFNTSVTGTTFIRSENTVAQPDWVGRLTARYGYGPFSLSYQLFYLSSVKAAPDATIENNPNPYIDNNVTHSISAQYEFGKFAVRAGVINFTDKGPSYPAISYGDILGRRWFVGATARF